MCVTLFCPGIVITWRPQTELAINTHAIVAELRQNFASAYAMVSGIYHANTPGWEGTDCKLSVGDIHISTSTPPNDY